MGGTSFIVRPYIIEALERFGSSGSGRWSDGEMFERYLRIFHGATSVVWETHTRDGGSYVTFDTAEWRESVGAPEGQANMDEYRAYLDGECYAYVIEERETWGRLNDQGELATANFGRREEWATVDACGGFYGSEYVEQAAREAFAAYQAPTVQVQREEV